MDISQSPDLLAPMQLSRENSPLPDSVTRARSPLLEVQPQASNVSSPPPSSLPSFVPVVATALPVFAVSPLRKEAAAFPAVAMSRPESGDMRDLLVHPSTPNVSVSVSTSMSTPVFLPVKKESLLSAKSLTPVIRSSSSLASSPTHTDTTVDKENEGDVSPFTSEATRKHRKNTREKLRRSELNDRFEILCRILSMYFVAFTFCLLFFLLLFF